MAIGYVGRGASGNLVRFTLRTWPFEGVFLGRRTLPLWAMTATDLQDRVRCWAIRTTDHAW
jgi:hypothetical protein